MIFGVTSPLAEAKSSKNIVMPMVIGPAPPYSGVPPAVDAVVLLFTVTDWLMLYSVGLNMNSSSYGFSSGMLLADA